MSTHNNGGPAFPRAMHESESFHESGSEGMSLRDYFAAQVLPALALGISQTHADNIRRGIPVAKVDAETERALGFLAQSSYRLADTMLAERDKAAP